MADTPAPAAITPAPVTEPPAASTTTLPPCEFEDGPGPCRWDAKTRGNGKGRSYTIDPMGTTYYDDAPASPVPGYSYAGQAHEWTGPTDGTGEAGIDARYHDEYGFPRREVLPSCDSVGSNESCAGPGYRILVSAGCDRLIVSDDGSQYLADPGNRPSSCESPVTHQWPADDTTAAGKDSAPTYGAHEDRAGLYGKRGDATAAAADDTATAAAADDTATAAAADDTAHRETVAGPTGTLARTGVPMDYDFAIGGIVALLLLGGLAIWGARAPRDQR